MISASPDSSTDCRFVRLMVCPRAATAAASVGPSAAAHAKAAARGTDGMIQWSMNPATSTLARTSAMAMDRMDHLFLQSCRRSDSCASRNRSGAMKRSRNSSASICTSARRGRMIAAMNPTAICRSGRDIREIT